MADTAGIADAARALLNAVERVDLPHRPQRITAAAARLREQLLVDERAETLLRVWLASWQGGLSNVPADDLAATRDLARQLAETLDYALSGRRAESDAGGHGEEADRG